MASGGGGEGQPHLRVAAQNINSNARRLREDLQTVVRSSLSPLMTPSGGQVNSSPSSLAAHLSHLLPPAPATPGQANSVQTVQTSPTTWQDNITVTVEPQLMMTSPRSPSHVLDIEVFQTHQQQQQQAGATADNNNSSQQPNLESDNGWSTLLNSNPELKAVVSACEKYIPFLLIVMVKSVFEHGTGIIVCLGLVLTFLHANSVLKQQVKHKPSI